MMLAAVLFPFSALLAGAAGSSAIFIVARIIGGSSGAASVISPAPHLGSNAGGDPVVVRPASTAGHDHHRSDLVRLVANFALARFAGGSTATLSAGPFRMALMPWLQAIPGDLPPRAADHSGSPRYLVVKGQEGVPMRY